MDKKLIIPCLKVGLRWFSKRNEKYTDLEGGEGGKDEGKKKTM